MPARLRRLALAALVATALAPPLVATPRAPGPRGAATRHWDVTSPDGRTTLVLTRLADGRLTWRALRGRTTVIADSPLGVERADQTFVDHLAFVEASKTTPVDETYETPYGKRTTHVVRGRERTVSFTNPAGRQLDVLLHAADDGVAFRYRFPDTDTIAKTVTRELTGFAVPAGSTAWIAPQQPVSQYGPAYEDLYREMPSGTSSPRPDGWAFPALFQTPGGPWVLLSESGMDGNYCGSHLAQAAPGGVYQIRFPDPAEGRGVGAAQPRAALPWTLPWRVAIIGDTAGQILESDLIDDLATPTRLTDLSWIHPGRAAWSWWSDSDSPKSAARLNAFTDLAADMTWEYNLVDANWTLMTQGTINDVVSHALDRHVKLLLWYNSGGPHNTVTEAPRDRMTDRTTRRYEMDRLHDWGVVAGIKVDFWQSDKQDRLQQYRALLEDAADYHLLVDFHGSTIPRGWEREFPHLVGMEAVAGAEQYKARPDYPAQAAWQNTVLPFTRNAIGTMDFTPVTFSDARYPHLTTDAHELALSVIFETGIQHFADRVAAYEGLPDAPRTFLQHVPVVWNETRAIEAGPGQFVTIARRAGAAWYVGGIAANTARTARVPLAFLGPGAWHMTLIADGATDREFASRTATVTSADTIAVAERARGGFVMTLVP